MRHRNEWHAPSQGLLDWAARLGVEVPTGISAHELRGLLRARGAQDARVRTSDTSQLLLTRMAELGPEEKVRFMRKHDGITYTLLEVFPVDDRAKVFNEKLHRVVFVRLAYFLEWYKLIDQ